MRLFILILGIITLLSCSEYVSNFKTFECGLPDSVINSNLRNVFKPCREYIFQVTYWNKDRVLISDEQIWIMATGKGWDADPEVQDEIIIQYEFDNSEIEVIKEYSINNEISNREWVRQEDTGIVENKYQTWMHPIRANQYSFTEVASFPYVKFPLEIGKTWTAKFIIHEGWGDWTNSTLNNSYEVLNHETIELDFIELEAWHIRGITYAEFGNSQHDFWYSENYGFIKMVIKNYENQLLVFELIKVKEGN